MRVRAGHADVDLVTAVTSTHRLPITGLTRSPEEGRWATRLKSRLAVSSSPRRVCRLEFPTTTRSN
jgi:hypothetical protein